MEIPLPFPARSFSLQDEAEHLGAGMEGGRGREAKEEIGGEEKAD